MMAKEFMVAIVFSIAIIISFFWPVAVRETSIAVADLLELHGAR